MTYSCLTSKLSGCTVLAQIILGISSLSKSGAPYAFAVTLRSQMLHVLLFGAMLLWTCAEVQWAFAVHACICLLVATLSQLLVGALL